MPISIVVEDGTGKTDANAYVSVASARAYAEARGKDDVLPEDDDDVAALIVQSTDYLETLPWKGTRTTTTQALAFPRCGVVIDGQCLADDVIPVRLTTAQSQAVLEIAVNGDLLPTQMKPGIKEKDIGPIKTIYFGGDNTDFIPRFPMLDAMLRQLLGTSGASNIFGVRV
jgi:hypothetical protein